MQSKHIQILEKILPKYSFVLEFIKQCLVFFLSSRFRARFSFFDMKFWIALQHDFSRTWRALQWLHTISICSFFFAIVHIMRQNISLLFVWISLSPLLIRTSILRQLPPRKCDKMCIYYVCFKLSLLKYFV